MILAGIYAFICTLGFCILFNTPKHSIIQAGIAGAIGWVVYVQAQDFLDSVVFAAFVGAVVVGILGEIFARIYKRPETLFIVPGIIPLVPGYGIYFAMLKAVENDYAAAMKSGVETILVAIAIASAVISTTSLGRVLKRWLRSRSVRNSIIDLLEDDPA